MPALAAVVVAAVALRPSVADSAPKPAVAAVADGSPRLVFSDEFDDGRLDTKKWNTCYDSYLSAFGGCTNHGNFESQWYTKSQVTVDDGNLVLTAEKKNTRGATRDGKEHYYDYTSGMVSTGRYITDSPAKWTGSYGYYEARINVPSGQAVWPAFWLLPVDHIWPPEIDIMEVLGDKPNELLTTYHWKGEPGRGVPQDSSTYVADASLAGEWHTYGVDWQPGVIDWYLDGVRVKHFANKVVTDTQMQVILNLAVGGTLPGYPDDTTPERATMRVDYVRVYESR